MITFVNGFLCASSCDVAKAKHGVDPRGQADGAQNPAKPEIKNGMVKADDAAVAFGGALSALQTAEGTVSSNAVTPTAAVDTANRTQVINLLV